MVNTQQTSANHQAFSSRQVERQDREPAVQHAIVGLVAYDRSWTAIIIPSGKRFKAI